MNRRRAVALVLTALLPVAGASRAEGTSKGIPITVYKSPTCGCCAGWASYLSTRGFAVTTIDQEDLSALKAKHGITPELRSCHTALVGGYVVEGHVPSADIHRLLEERPAIVGLTAPGMPMMSPGMASIEPRDYDVLQFDREGRVAVFSRY